MQNLNVKKLSPLAKIPTRAHGADAGLDLYSAEDVVVIPNQVTRVGTGIAVDIPAGYVGYVKPRSGLAASNGIDVLAGVIDAGYHGEVVVLLTTNMQPAQPFYPEGTKIAQLVIQKVELPEVVVVEEFIDETERGEDGFGSTGTN